MRESKTGGDVGGVTCLDLFQIAECLPGHGQMPVRAEVSA